MEKRNLIVRKALDEKKLSVEYLEKFLERPKVTIERMMSRELPIKTQMLLAKLIRDYADEGNKVRG